MNSDRSRRPSSRSASASWLGLGEAASFFRIAEGATTFILIEAAKCSNSSQWARIRSLLMGVPIWLSSPE